MMADKIDPPDDAPLDLDDINILRKFFLDELARGAARETRLQSDFKALQADNWRLIQKTERDKPPEIWLPLKAASTGSVWGKTPDGSTGAPASISNSAQSGR